MLLIPGAACPGRGLLSSLRRAGPSVQEEVPLSLEQCQVRGLLCCPGPLERRQIARRSVCADAPSYGALEYLRSICTDKGAGIISH